MSYSILDILDNNCLECIASVLVSPLNAPLRAICARMHAVIEKPTQMHANELLIYGAVLGDAGGIAVCKLARDHGAMKFNSMLKQGAEVGSRAICELARKWILETSPFSQYVCVFRCAAQHGHRDICELAWQWLCEDKPPRTLWKYALNLMIANAARAKTRQRELCELAFAWIGRANALMKFKPIRVKSSLMLCSAALAGNLEICILAQQFQLPEHLSSHSVRNALSCAQRQEIIDFLKSLLV